MAQEHLYVSADQPSLRDAAWLAAQWERAATAARTQAKGAVLAVDEDPEGPWLVGDREAPLGRGPRARRRAQGRPARVGAAPRAAGPHGEPGRPVRSLHLPHWSFAEMRDAFGFTLDQYLYFGGYPGAAPLVERPGTLAALPSRRADRDHHRPRRPPHDPRRQAGAPAALCSSWAAGIPDRCSPTRRCSASFTTRATRRRSRTTSSCLAAPGCSPDSRSTPGGVRQRGRVPKLQVLNTALMTAQSDVPPRRAWPTGQFRGRLVESAVGASSGQRGGGAAVPTSSTGANGTARWTSWSVRPKLHRNRSKSGASGLTVRAGGL